MHWYTTDGRACHTVIAKNGLPRDTTLADARKLGLLPGVTDVIKSTLAAPELERWKILQSIQAALTLPEVPGESLDARARRIQVDSEAQAKKAAEHGKAVHDAICKHLHGQEVPVEMEPYIKELDSLIHSRFNGLFQIVRSVWSEKILVSPSYAGTADWFIETDQGFAVVDFKGQDFGQRGPAFRGNYWIQLAAYADAIGDSVALVGVVVFDRKTARMEFKFRTLKEIAPFTRIWRRLVGVWRDLKGYYPGSKKLEEAA